MSRFISLRAAGVLACLAASSPALAHHSGQSFGGGAGGPINTISAATLPAGSFQAGVSGAFTLTDRFSGARLARLAANHVHAHSTHWTQVTSVEAGYGLADNLDISLRVPHVYRRAVRSGSHVHGGGGGAVNSAVDHGDSIGPGDAAMLAKYRFFAHDGAGASLLLGVKAPTGRTDAAGNGAPLEAEHQPGSGAWDLLWGAAAQAEVAPGVVIGASFLHTVATKGAYNADPGDRLQYDMGVARRLDGCHCSGMWDAVLELNGEWAGQQRVNGQTDRDSGGSVVFLSPGVRFTPQDGAWSVHASLGVPVFSSTGPGHPETALRVVTGIVRGF